MIMTLDEAIKHCEEKAKEIRKANEEMPTDCKLSEDLCECAREHEQLAEWLTELKAYKEASKGDLISREALKEELQAQHDFYINSWKENGVEPIYIPIPDKSRIDEINTSIAMVINAPTVVTDCENCPFKKFSEDMVDKIVKVMIDNGITDFDEFAKACGVSYLHQDSITKSDTQI